MNLRDYLSIVQGYWKSILAVTVIGVLAAVAVAWASSLSAQYVTRASVFLTATQGSTALEVVGGAGYATAQAQAFARIADMEVVTAPVAEGVGLGLTTQDVETSITAWNDSSIVQIEVSHPDQATTTAIAQAAADQLVKAVERLSPVDDSGRPVLTADVVHPAGVPARTESGPSAKSMIALGLLAGMVFGLGQAAFRKVLALSTPGDH